jgi:hypothetical protein
MAMTVLFQNAILFLKVIVFMLIKYMIHPIIEMFKNIQPLEKNKETK